MIRTEAMRPKLLMMLASLELCQHMHHLQEGQHGEVPVCLREFRCA